MEKGFYHPERGYWQVIESPSNEELNSYPAGTVEVPIKPDIGYEFDGSKWVAPTQEWLYDHHANEVKAKRDYFLRRHIDKVVSNPLRWADMSANKQQEWANYRQALLDITQQEGFPFDVTWPVKPD